MISGNEGWIAGDVGRMANYTEAYQSEGSFESSILDTNPEENPSFEYVFWSEDLPEETYLTVATRTGDSPLPDETWSAWETESSERKGTPIESPNARYFQMRATFGTHDPLKTPLLYELLTTYK